MKLIVSTLVIVGLLFGGNATVAAAQNDLPTEPLYQIKLMSEDVNLWFVADPVQEIDMLMQQAQTRIQEMQMLASRDVNPPAELSIRAQERIQRALQIAAGLDGPTQEVVLQKIQTRLRTQEQQMSQLSLGTCRSCDPILQQTREMLRLHLSEVQSELATPVPTQNQFQNQNQIQNQNQTRATQTPQTLHTAVPPQVSCTPVMDGTGQQNGSGNPSAGTPAQQTNQQNQQKGNEKNGSGSGSENDNNESPGSGGGPGSQGGQGGKP